MIRPLLEEVRSYLRSGVAITNLTQCVEELVLNSLDAGASSVTVRIDIPNFKIQVSDNGSGIAFEDLKLVGERYSSSKCHDLEDLEHLNFYGFRGEALASVREICDVLEIVSRHRCSYQTYCKLFRNSQVLELAESRFPRTSSGTTVTIHNIFANLPVRRKSIVETIDFERVRHRIASVALIHPKTAFLLINDTTGTKSLQTHVCKSSISTFSQLFGNNRSKGLRPVHFEQNNLKVSGFISTDTHHSKSLQFLFVNSRLLLKTTIHKLVNSILGKSELLRKLPPCELDGARSEGYQSKVTSPPSLKPSDKHGIFVLNVDCPVTEYDICLEPAKTLIEFQDWDNVLYCVQRCVEEFLTKHNLTSQCEQSPKSTTSGSDDDKDGFMKGSCHPILDSFEYKKEIETSNVKKSLHSSTVFRQKKVETGHNRLENKASCHKENSLSPPWKFEDSINNDASRNVTLGHSVGSVYHGHGNSKSVLKGKSSYSVKKLLASCSDITNVERSCPSSVEIERKSSDSNHRDQQAGDLTTSSSITASGNSTVTTSNTVEVSEKCSCEVNCTFEDLMHTPSRSGHCLLRDSQASFCQARENGDRNLPRNSLIQNGFPESQKVCDLAVSFDNEEHLQERNLHFGNSFSSKQSPIAKPGNATTSSTKVDKSRMKTMSAFTSPSPIMLQRVCARKRPQWNKETSVSSLEVVVKSRRLITLQGSWTRRDRCNSNLARQSRDVDDDENNAACCHKKIVETTSSSESLTPPDDDAVTRKHVGTCNHPDSHPERNDDNLSHCGDSSPGVTASPGEACDSAASFPANEQFTSDKTVSFDHMCSSSLNDKPNQPVTLNIVQCQSGTAFCDTEQGPVLQNWVEKASVVGKKGLCGAQSSQGSASSESNIEHTSVAGDKCEKRGSKSSLDNDWYCTFDASLGRNLFINTRTGHSSFEPPPSRLNVVNDDCAETSEAEANREESDHSQHIPHPVASHLSFSCTPWLPREERKQQASLCENRNGTSKGSSQLAILCQEHHDNQETEEKLCKWTDADKLKAYEKVLFNRTDKTVAEMLDRWENPVFGAPEKDILMVNKPGGCVKNQISVHNVVHPYRFITDMLADMRVLQQIDDKFIVGVVSQGGDSDNLLIIVDQHAAHERVRLEQLQSELFEGTGISSHDRPQIKSSPVTPPLEIVLFAEEVQLLKTFQTEMERIGLRFVISESAQACEETLISIRGVPSVLVEREVSEVKRGRPSVAVSKVKELIREHLEHVLTTCGVPPVIPKVISQVISSQACHGAVKFGEPLGVAECQELIKRLSKCQLPFQCAHGRPSVIPLADLKFLGKKMVPQDSECRPRISKLRSTLIKQQ